MSELKISTPAFKNSGSIPRKYTCNGENINPRLDISGVPDGAKSLAFIMDDPDVPKNLRPDGVFVHWVVFNISPDISVIKEGREPEGVAGNNSAGRGGYVGPCPPDREHRYFFKLYALDVVLDLPEGSKKAQVEEAMEGHILGQAELIGKYDKER